MVIQLLLRFWTCPWGTPEHLHILHMVRASGAPETQPRFCCNKTSATATLSMSLLSVLSVVILSGLIAVSATRRWDLKKKQLEHLSQRMAGGYPEIVHATRWSHEQFALNESNAMTAVCRLASHVLSPDRQVFLIIICQRFGIRARLSSFEGSGFCG